MARFAAGAERHGDRQAAHQRRHGGHHDRPEAHQASFVNRFGGVLALLALRLDREVYHHDRVLLDDADQHDHADEGVHVELDAEGEQGQQRAECRRRQTRQYRQRVDEAFVEYAEHEVNHDHGQHQEQAHALQRGLERLRRPLETGVERCRYLQLLHGTVDFGYRLRQRYAFAQVEGKRDRGQLAEMGDRKRTHAVGEFGQGVQRHHRAAGGTYIEFRQQRRVGLKVRLHPQHHRVLVGRGVDGGHLVLAVGVIQSELDLLHADA